MLAAIQRASVLLLFWGTVTRSVTQVANWVAVPVVLHDMADGDRQKALRRRVEDYRTDYRCVTGKPFEYFFCPILRTDEDVQLCRGHIVSDAFGSNLWVPQRADVDNFFGAAIEADFVK